MNGSEEKVRLELKKNVVFLYSRFRAHWGPTPQYHINYGNRENTLLDNFLDILKESYDLNTLGGRFFVDYFYFHFSFWHNIETQFGNIPLLNWCVGKKGVERWLTRRDSWKFWANKNLGTIPDNITFSLNTTGSATKKVHEGRAKNKMFANFKPKHFLEINKFEEDDKERFYDTYDGFLNCVQFTTLYNKKSKLCRRCKYSKRCKKVLKEEFSEIAELRGI